MPLYCLISYSAAVSLQHRRPRLFVVPDALLCACFLNRERANEDFKAPAPH